MSYFETIETDPKKEPFIPIWRTSYLDVSGEYLPGKSWEGEKKVAESHCGSMAMVLRVKVFGSFFSRTSRLRPTAFIVRLGMKGYSHTDVDLTPKAIRCKSLREVDAKVSALPYEESVPLCVQRFYDLSRARCLYKKEGNSWIPFCTSFDPWGGVDDMPIGDYGYISRYKPNDPSYFIELRKGWDHKSSGGGKVIPQEVVEWTPEWNSSQGQGAISPA